MKKYTFLRWGLPILYLTLLTYRLPTQMRNGSYLKLSGATWSYLELSACYGLLCMALLCFALFVGRALSHVTVCFALIVGEGSCHTLRFASFCSALVCFGRARRKQSHVTICFAFLGFASLCIALRCFALLMCGVAKKANQKHAIRYTKSKPTSC